MKGAPFKYEVRMPDVLMLDPDVPDWAKMVWMAIRSIQGRDRTCDEPAREIAARAGKSTNQVYKAKAKLKAAGYLATIDAGDRCCVPCEEGRYDVLSGDVYPPFEKAKPEQDSGSDGGKPESHSGQPEQHAGFEGPEPEHHSEKPERDAGKPEQDSGSEKSPLNNPPLRETKKPKNQQQQHTEEGRARGTDGAEDAAATSGQNEFGLEGTALAAARQLYRAGVDGNDGRIAQQLTAEHGEQAVRRQLRNLSMRQASGNAPQRPGAWLVSAIEDDYDLPGEGRGRPQQQKHRGDGRAGNPPGGASPRRPQHRPPEHEPSGPAEEAPGKDLPDDVMEQLTGLKEQTEERRQQLGRKARNRRAAGLQAKRIELFRARYHTGRFEVEPPPRGLLLKPPIWDR